MKGSNFVTSCWNLLIEAEVVKLNSQPHIAESICFVTVKVIQQEKGTRCRCVVISEKPVYGQISRVNKLGNKPQGNLDVGISLLFVLGRGC